jgi:antitoxin (DNA-binding transcriptional repressor) of toxin-antitoxin stability system
MTEIGIEEARKSLGDIANRAALAGQITYLTRNGKRIAAIVPMERQYVTVTFASPEQAHFLADMPELVGNGHRVGVDGATVVLSRAALAVLAEQPDDRDGHFDGRHVWIGGSEYVITLT